MLYGFTYGNAADDLDELVRLGSITQTEREELSMEQFLAWTPGAKYRTARVEHLDPLNGEEEDVPAWMRVKKLMRQFSLTAGEACELRYMLACFDMMYLIYDGYEMLKDAIAHRGLDAFIIHLCVKYGFMYEESDDPIGGFIRTHRREMVVDESESPTTSSGNTKVIFGLTAQQVAHCPSRVETMGSLKELAKRAIRRSKDGTIKMDRYWWNIFWDCYRQRKAELSS